MKTRFLSGHLRITRAIIITALSTAMTFVRAAETPPKPIFPDASPVCSCESLTKVSLPNTTIDSAALDPANGSCRVTATVTHPPSSDRVRIFIGLPVTNWNGRFRGNGGGGFSGGSAGSLGEPVAQGYAAGATDTGHEGGSGSFALDANGRLNWQSIVDNAYLGIHEMTVVGKALTQAFYGKAPRYSYFVGGSTGGRQGLMEVQRFPLDYKRVQQQMGGPEKAAQFARLFLVPGVDHGFNGAGSTPTGQMEAIVRWVEEGQAPDKLTAERRDSNGKVIQTRTLFPYPQVPK